MEPIRIFIASPGDVSEERQRAHRVIGRLSREFKDRAELKSVIWEHEPLLATADFQSQIGTPATSDIFVVILWARFGSPLGGNFKRQDGSLYASATEYEFEEAIAAYRDTGKPRILVYRKTSTAPLERDEDRLQKSAVETFFGKWFRGDDAEATGAYHEFAQASGFENLLELHLRKTLLDHLPNPSNLPLPANTFVGRRELSEKVQAMLTRDDVRLVVLAGPGGAGKTRLSQHVGRELLQQFRDGVFFVSLASVTDPDVVPTSIAETMGVRDPRGLDIDDVVRHLKLKELLLIVDNLEQVQSAGKYLQAVLRDCVGVKIIVTSREALRLSTSHTIQVPPLAMPAPGKLPSVEELRKIEAVRLFEDRATSVREDFELNAENAHAVVDVCRRVDALPLAIELAASRLRTMSPQRLSEALERRFKVLTGGSEDLLIHQRSLRELIAWSYDLLSSREQRLWRRLAVFSDGCFIEVAQNVCDPGDEYLIEVDVESLVDKSLVKVDVDARLSRISMLESLREFAWEKLSTSDEYELINERFSDWCSQIGLGADRLSPEEAVLRIEQEQNNLRAALERHIQANRSEEALNLCYVLRPYWFARGLAKEGIQWIERALEIAEDLTVNYGRALGCLVALERSCGEVESAIRHANEALEISSSLGDETTQAVVLCERGALATGQGEHDAASAFLDECLRVANKAGVSEERMSHFLIVQGVTEHLKDHLDRAKQLYIEGLDKARHAGSRTGIANALLNLGEILDAEGDYDESYSHYRESLALCMELQHMHGIASCAEMMAGLEAGGRNRPYQAVFLLGASAALREEIGEPVEAFNTKSINDNIARCRASLGTQTFEEVWNYGWSLGVEGIRRIVVEGDEEYVSTLLVAE